MTIRPARRLAVAALTTLLLVAATPATNSAPVDWVRLDLQTGPGTPASLRVDVSFAVEAPDPEAIAVIGSGIAMPMGHPTSS